MSLQAFVQPTESVSSTLNVSITLLDNLTYRTCRFPRISKSHHCHARRSPAECDLTPLTRSSQEVKGEFCECDNFSCDRHEKRLCSGPEHGSCVCGKCSCLPDWTGEACQCPASNATCIAPGLVWSGLVWSGQVRSGRSDLIWSGLVWSGLVWSVTSQSGPSLGQVDTGHARPG